MTNQVPEGGLHPNIARIAAAYDIIIEQMANNQLTVTQARAKIAQLEARDDQGVRWSIDPDTGGFVRKTAMGAELYDAPPMVGYQTPDAFSYTQPDPFTGSGSAGPRAENPNGRLEMYAAENPNLTLPPAHLAGATRAAGPANTGRARAPLATQPALVKAVAAAAALIVLLLLAAIAF